MTQYEIIIRLVLALVLGAILGVERVHAGKSAGVRTLGLVSLGAAFFVIISEMVISRSDYSIDPLRVAASVVSGIGFLGAGMIIFQQDHLANLTTAAGVWVAAAIGLAVGFGLYFPAFVVTLLVVVTFTFMWSFENRIKKQFHERQE